MFSALNLSRGLRRPKLRSAGRILSGLLLVAFFFAHEAEWISVRFLHQLELWSYDARLRLALPHEPESRVVIVDIDEKSLNAEGRFPWPRERLAELVRQLFERYDVAVAAFDMALPEPDRSSGLPVLEALAANELSGNRPFLRFLEGSRASLNYDQLLAEQLAKWPVVLGVAFGGKTDESGVLPEPAFTAADLGDAHYPAYVATGFSGNLPRLQEAAVTAGHLYPALDVDGTTRRVPAFLRHGDGYYESLSLATLRTYLGDAKMKVVVDEPTGGGDFKQGWMRAIEIDGKRIPLDRSMSVLVPFRAPGSIEYVSATDVIRGTLPADALERRIAMIGTSAQGLVDLRSTPVRKDLPGVEVHASLLVGMLNGTVKSRPPESVGFTVGAILLLGLPLAFLLPRLTALGATVATFTLVAGVLAGNLYLWESRNWVLPLAPLLLMLLLLYVLNVIYGFFFETRARRLITSLFGTYVPSALVSEMAKNPEDYSMKGESREMTVLFSDVRDFTAISEGLPPETLKELMNTYLTAMTEEIQSSRGTIDKYIGDAIMSFWGAPLPDTEHASHAIAAALAMQRRIRTLDAVFAGRGWPTLHIGIGLNTGTMSVGDMGSAFRRSYTVLGDSVNLAARLEGLTKEYGVGILVSEHVANAATQYDYREIDRVRVKGKQQAITICEPLGRKGETDGPTLARAAVLADALDAFRHGRWDLAASKFEALGQTPADSKLASLYLGRITHFRQHPPPEGWDGVTNFTTK